MSGLSDAVQKAFYLGVGIASYAGEKAGENLSKLRSQAQKLADEMVERGELTAEEAKRMVDDMVSRAQVPGEATVNVSAKSTPTEPRHIEITDEPDTDTAAQPTNDLKQKVADLEEQLRQLKQ